MFVVFNDIINCIMVQLQHSRYVHARYPKHLIHVNDILTNNICKLTVLRILGIRQTKPSNLLSKLFLIFDISFILMETRKLILWQDNIDPLEIPLFRQYCFLILLFIEFIYLMITIINLLFIDNLDRTVNIIYMGSLCLYLLKLLSLILRSSDRVYLRKLQTMINLVFPLVLMTIDFLRSFLRLV